MKFVTILLSVAVAGNKAKSAIEGYEARKALLAGPVEQQVIEDQRIEAQQVKAVEESIAGISRKFDALKKKQNIRKGRK